MKFHSHLHQSKINCIPATPYDEEEEEELQGRGDGGGGGDGRGVELDKGGRGGDTGVTDRLGDDKAEERESGMSFEDVLQHSVASGGNPNAGENIGLMLTRVLPPKVKNSCFMVFN